MGNNLQCLKKRTPIKDQNSEREQLQERELNYEEKKVHLKCVFSFKTGRAWH